MILPWFISEKVVKAEGRAERAAKWEKLMSPLPEYKYDKSCALCEWAMTEYEENKNRQMRLSVFVYTHNLYKTALTVVLSLSPS